MSVTLTVPCHWSPSLFSRDQGGGLREIEIISHSNSVTMEQVGASGDERR